jgi:hypothetical protein
MTQAIIFTNDNGGVSTCIPTGEISIDAVMTKDVPAGRGARIVNLTDLPRDNDFYDAWEMDATSVTVNFAKAVEITKARLRAERTPLLAAQDVAFQRALESNADTTAIVAEKQRLRDITNITATTLDELRALKAEKKVVAPVEEVVAPVEEVVAPAQTEV